MTLLSAGELICSWLVTKLGQLLSVLSNPRKHQHQTGAVSVVGPHMPTAGVTVIIVCYSHVSPYSK